MAELPEDDAPEAAAPAEPPAKKKGGALATIAGLFLVTLLAGGAGGGLGIRLADVIGATVSERIKAEPGETAELRYSGDMVLRQLEPVVTNLADPGNVWIRLETAIVFKNGALGNPDVTAAEIRQDIMAYARTLPIAQLEGSRALQHIREDLNERVATRTNGEVSELIVETMIVQ